MKKIIRLLVLVQIFLTTNFFSIVSSAEILGVSKQEHSNIITNLDNVSTVSKTISAVDTRESLKKFNESSGTQLYDSTNIVERPCQTNPGDKIVSSAINTENSLKKIKNESTASSPKHFTSSEDIASGNFGTSPWRIDAEGTLRIGSGNFDYTDTSSPWASWASEIKKVIFEGKVVAGARSNYLFLNFVNVTAFDNLQNFDMSNVKGASNIFANCSSLTTLDLSGTNAGQSSGGLSNTGIFAGCTNLKSLNLTNVKFSPDYTEAFLGDSNLSEITIDGSFGFANELSGYPDIPNNEAYTGNWINVGTGSVDNPAGTTILSSSALFSFGNPADTYVWQKRTPVAGGNVTVRYLDTKGNPISEDVILKGEVGEEYKTEQKAIAGYTFKEVQGNPIGQFTKDPQTVTYIYARTPVAGGNVTVRYLDTKGNPISEDVILKGEVGEEYKTEQKAIAGYTFKEVQGNPIGQFTKDPQTVTYIYARNATGPSNSEQKRDDKPNYKNEKHYNRMSNSNKKLLPKTGENQKISFICIGVVLLCVVTTIYSIRLIQSKN